MSDPTTDAQLDEFLEIRKPGAHLEEGVVADDFVLMLGVDLEQLPEVPPGRRRRHLPEGGPRHPPAARRRLRRRAPRLQRPVPGRPALHRLLEGGAGHQVPAVERPVPAALRRRVGHRGRQALRRRDDGRDRMDGLERPDRPRARPHEERVPPRRHRRTTTRTSRSPSKTGSVPGSSTPGCSRPVRTASSSPRNNSSPGSSGVTNTCCSASRGGPRRSSFATGSTRCSTSSTPSGATSVLPGVKKLKEE